MKTGEQLKLEGLARVAENNDEWLLHMRDQAAYISYRHGKVSTDDLRAYMDKYGEPTHPNAWGAIFKGTEWKSIGWHKSTYPSNHGRFIRVWIYVGDSE